VSSEGPARRREIEDSTAARLAEIVAAAERAAKQVIDEAEAEARTRLADAHEEADRIVAERLAGLADLTDEIGAQAEALRRQAETLEALLAQARAEMGGSEEFGGPATTGRLEAEPYREPGGRKPLGPALKVVGGSPPEEPAPPRPADTARDAVPDSGAEPEPRARRADDPAPPTAAGGTPAGARLLATQMAVSGSSREEIEARLRNGFAIDDTRAILDAILGPEQ
jgi:vacuolar-type H+-ATPase subunit H